jgi:hypothetical protein
MLTKYLYVIRGGEHRLSETEVLTPETSYNDEYQIACMACPGDNPVFSSKVDHS